MAKRKNESEHTSMVSTLANYLSALRAGRFSMNTRQPEVTHNLTLVLLPLELAILETLVSIVWMITIRKPLMCLNNHRFFSVFCHSWSPLIFMVKKPNNANQLGRLKPPVIAGVMHLRASASTASIHAARCSACTALPS